MAYRRHNPHRFDEYEEFTDGTGFTVHENGRDIDFYYDSNGGWFDEQGDYYGSDGKPAKPSQQSLKFWDRIRSKYQQYDDLEDIINQYDQADNYDESDNELEEIERAYRYKDEISKMKLRLKAYPENQEIQVYFENADWKQNEDSLAKAFGKQYVKKIVFETNHNYKTGKGHIIAVNKAAAEQIILKHSIEIDNKQIFFMIEALDHIDSDDELVTVQINQEQRTKEEDQPQKQQNQPQQQQQQQQQSQQQQSQQQQQSDKSQPIKSKQSQQVEKQAPQNNFVVIDQIPKSETEQQVLQWINSKLKKSWENIEVKQRPDKTWAARLHFGQNKDAQTEVIGFFNTEANKQYKGICKISAKPLQQ